MTKSIKSLLSKKGWTGEEVGKALIASLLNDVRNVGKPHAPLFSPADFERMESSISTERDFLAYGIYRDIYNGILDSYNRGQGAYQQYHNGYYRLYNYLRATMQAEDVEKSKTQYPLIMTAEQYKRIEAETAEELRGYPESFHGLLFSLLSYFMDICEDEEKNPSELIPAPILEAIEATKKEPVTNQRILGLYNEEMGEGYYQLPDGRRSDKLSSEEWERAVGEEYLKTHKLTLNGRPASAEETARYFNSAKILRGHELFFNGADYIRRAFKESTGQDLEGTDEEILKELEDIINDSYHTPPITPLRKNLTALYTESTPTEWHYYEAPPADLTKYDILSQLLEQYNGAVIERASEREQFKEFKRDYPDLYKALDTYIRETVPGAKELKATQLFKEIFSWGQLSDLGLPYYRTLSTPAQSDIVEHLRESGQLSFLDAERATTSGIAILQEPRKYQLDEDGNYSEYDIYSSRLETLQSIEDSNTIAEIADLRDRLFSPAIQYLTCYRALMKVLGEVYGIEGAEDACTGLELTRIKNQIESYNSMIHFFYFNAYGSPEEIQTKRRQIRDIFKPIIWDDLEPDPEAVEELKARLVKLGVSAETRKTLKDFLPLIVELFKGKGA